MTPPHRNLLDALREVVREVTPEEAGHGDSLLLDIREPYEFATGVLPGAALVPQGDIPERIGEVAPDPSRPIVVYCATGQRSLFVARWLEEQGYRDVASMAGGIVAWRERGMPVVDTPAPAESDAARYARHLVLPGIGEEGQQRLRDARVLVVGAGGLGSPVALYLAAAGVGSLGIVDDEVVELSNLHRQVIHDTPSIGTPKVESAARTVGRLNPDVEVVAFEERLDASTAERITTGWDVVVDATDDFPTRYLLNDAALRSGTPLAHGAIFRWEGQISVFSPYRGPCYRCLFPRPPAPESAPGCAEAGVLGVLPGVIGSLLAAEVIKLIVEAGQPLIGRLLLYDALEQSFTTLAVDRDPVCVSCADEQSPPDLIDYDETCLR